MSKMDKIHEGLLTASANGDWSTIETIIAELSEEDGLRKKIDADVMGQVLINTVSYTQDPEGSVQTADLILSDYADVIDPSYIGQTLYSYARNGDSNYSGVNMVIDHITAEVAGQLDPTLLGDALSWVVGYRYSYTAEEVNATLDHFLDVLAGQTDPDAIGYALQELAYDIQDFDDMGVPDINIVLNHITPEIAAQIDPQILDDAFIRVARGIRGESTYTSSLEHFLDVFIEYVSPSAFEDVLTLFADEPYWNLDNIEVLLDYVTPEISSLLTASGVDSALIDIVWRLGNQYELFEESTALIDHFLDVFADQIYPYALLELFSSLMVQASYDSWDYKAYDDYASIVLDHFTPEMAATLDPDYGASGTLGTLINVYSGRAEISQFNALLDKFFDLFAGQLHPHYIDYAMAEMAWGGSWYHRGSNLEGLNIILDHITPEILEKMESWADTDYVNPEDTLYNLVDAAQHGIDSVAINATIDRYLDMFIEMIQYHHYLTYALEQLAQAGNLDGVNIVLDYITPEIAASIEADKYSDPIHQGQALQSIINAGQDPDVTTADVNATIDNFMDRLGTLTASDYIDWALNELAVSDNFDGANAIIDNLSETQVDALVGSQVASDLAAQDIYIGTSAGEWIYGTENSDVIYGGQGDDYLWGYNNGGNDTLYGNDGNDYLFGSLDNSDTINGGAGNDILYGGNTADTYIFDNLDGVDALYTFSAAVGDVLDFSALLDGYDPVTDAITDFLIATDNGNSVTIAVDTDGTGTEQTATDVVTVLNTPDLDIQALVDGGTIIV